MEKLGQRLVCLKGTRKEIYRVVYKDEVGSYFIKLYGELIEVVQRNGEEATKGWVTVDEC